jgi:hypothetical protein
LLPIRSRVFVRQIESFLNNFSCSKPVVAFDLRHRHRHLSARTTTRRSTSATAQVNAPRSFRGENPGTPVPCALCYLCFPSVQISLLLLSAVKDQACRTLLAQTGICRRTIPERQSSWPLLPLLPSVQISLLTFVRRQRPSLPNATRPNGNLSKDHPGTPIPLALCYLCFLLFKFLC